jgi:hypothetical protein
MQKAVLLIFLTIILFLPASVTARAATFARVHIRAEGADGTIAAGETAAFTFDEALKNLAENFGIKLTFTQSAQNSGLTKVEHSGGQTAETGTGGQWLGYILRNGDIVRQKNFLGLSLESGDELVLYAGDYNRTKIASHFTAEASADGVSFFIGSTETEWLEENNIWALHTSVRPIEGANIHLSLPDAELSARTDTEGRLFIPAAEPGVAYYYAEGYQPEAVPLLVRTPVAEVVCGFDMAAETVTRAEAVTFLQNALAGIIDEADHSAAPAFSFTDVTPETKYADKIYAAVSGGFVFGYEDGTFRPDEPISILQLTVLASRILAPEIYPSENSAPAADGAADVPKNKSAHADSPTNDKTPAGEDADVNDNATVIITDIPVNDNIAIVTGNTPTDENTTTVPTDGSASPAAEEPPANPLPDGGTTPPVLPEWAMSAVRLAETSGWLDSIGLDWTAPVTPPVLARLYEYIRQAAR